MYSTFLNWIKGLTTLAIILVSLYIFYQYREDFYLIAKVSPTIFIALLLLVILSIIINGNKLRNITQSFNIELLLKEWVGLAFISSSLNGVVYKSGSIITSNYLKRKYGFPYTSFIGAVGADHFMLVLINASVGFGISIYTMTVYPEIFPITCLFLVVGIALLYLIINPVNVSRTEKRFLDALSRVTITLNDIFKNKKLFKKLFLNNSILVFLTGLRLFIACKAIGIDFELLHCYLYTTVWAFVRLIPMLQSDIGSRELATGFLSEILGSGFKEGILATAVDRIFEMALALVGTTIFKNILLSSRHEPDNTKGQLTANRIKHQQLHLHDERYINRLLTKESNSRIMQLSKLIELKGDFAVADFACGNGKMLEFVDQKIGEYFGVDFSPSAIKNAEIRKKKLGATNAHFFCDSIQSFCEKNQEKFDIGIAFDFSEHVGDEEWLQTLSSIKRSLKKGGKLYMHTPNGNFFLERMKSKNFIFKQFPEHIAVRSARQNIILLEKAGYKIKDVNFLSHYNILKYINIFSFIPWLGSYFQARLFVIAVKV